MSLINGNTRILGLIGASIEHSKSFHLHNYCIENLGLDAVYLPFQAQTSSFETLFGLDNFLGANVTMPYKISLMESMDTVTETALRIGAINTIYKINDQLVGDNTDSAGFASALSKFNIPWTEYEIYLIGAGGAARAICCSLEHFGVQKIFVWNRTKSRCAELSSSLTIQSWDRSTPTQPSIIIQCTPLGQHGEDPVPNVQFDANSIVIDLLYKQTPLLKRVHASGGLGIGGLGMLVHQAALSFAQWFQCAPPIHMMESIPEIRSQLEKSA